ncbi:MAG: hypothetical protein V4760_13525 [Bdellovibrionota bacterium]
MTLNNLKATVFALGAAVLVAACGGGGGGGTGPTPGPGPGTVYYTHEQLAAEFVDRAWGEAGLDLSLAKTNTLQYDYIVVYDYDYGTYDAYYIGAYSPGMNVANYINAYSSSMYYDLDYLGGNQYQDWYTGLVFEEGAPTSKDLAKVAAFKQEVRVQKSAKKIQADFGLSEERSREVAKLAVQLADAPKSSMTTNDYDNFSKELLGSSISQFNQAMKKSAEGDTSALNGLLDKAAKVNGVGPEHMNKIVGELFQ